MSAGRSFVGIGFGAIQAGLFLREAHRSGNFRSHVIAARRADLVRAVRHAGDRVSINIAHADRIETETLGPVQMRVIGDAEDRLALIGNLTRAHEIAIAVSSVDDYRTDGPESLHRLLAEAVRGKMSGGGPKVLIYAAENDLRAAHFLELALLSALPDEDHDAARQVFQTVDTVIGKMSRVVTDAKEIRGMGLGEVAPGLAHAFLAEAFNRILISQVDETRTSGRGIRVFEEKPDLMSFEQAKLHGHNAMHAALAYIGQCCGCTLIAEAAAIAPLLELCRTAFRHEAGDALIALHGGKDPLFSREGFDAHVDDLMTRTVNPCLGDTCARVGRDPLRKLGWNDRLIGTMRLALASGIRPDCTGFATLAALKIMQAGEGIPAELEASWRGDGADASQIAELVSMLDTLRPAFVTWLGEVQARSAGAASDFA